MDLRLGHLREINMCGFGFFPNQTMPGNGSLQIRFCYKQKLNRDKKKLFGGFPME